MIFLQKHNVIRINKLTVEAHGGNFTPPRNVLNEQPLDYVLEIVNAEMFGEPLYPEVYDKAAVYMFNIISNHIFMDGNKRTGLESATGFLKLNGFRLNKKLTSSTIIDFTMKIASGESDLEECRAWFKENIQPLV
jgi:death on curing protein